MQAPELSRRQFVGLAVGTSLGLVCAACGSSATPAKGQTAHFRSRPDLAPPVVTVVGPEGRPAAGLVFVTPGGPVILDDAGSPVWVHKVPHACTTFRTQQYRGEPILAWWEGTITHYGVGEDGRFVLMDRSYREIQRVQAGNGLVADLHELVITDRGTAYLLAYQNIPADLTAVKGPKKGRMLDVIVQEVDLATGAVLFEWHSSEHIPITETHRVYSKKTPFDPYHLNSIEPTADGKLLLSARHTWAVYKVDPGTGDILWRLGGKKSDFELGPGVRFAWQHDARQHPDNTITVFDNEAEPAVGRQSRGLMLDVDEGARKATLVRAYVHPGKPLLADSQGSMQVLPNGDVLVGWGSQPYYTEFRNGGSLVLDATFGKGQSYRAFRFPWTGTPLDQPALAVQKGAPGHLTVYASWNGATGVDSWTVLAGPSPAALTTVGAAPKTGFETAVPARTMHRYVAVQAVDASGDPIRTSRTVRV